MTGGGLKKCIPITCSGRPEATASSTIGIDDVFEASTTSARRDLAQRPEDVELRLDVLGRRLDHQVRRRREHAGRSRRGSGRGPPRLRRRRACRARRPCRPNARSTRGPRATSSSVPSTNVTSAPARARTSTIPEPIRPHPTTPTERISFGSNDPPPPRVRRPSAYNPAHERSSPGRHVGHRGGRRARRALAHVPGSGAARGPARGDPAPDRSRIPGDGERPRARRRPRGDRDHLHRSTRRSDACRAARRGSRHGSFGSRCARSYSWRCSSA